MSENMQNNHMKEAQTAEAMSAGESINKEQQNTMQAGRIQAGEAGNRQAFANQNENRQIYEPKTETLYHKKMKEHFNIFGVASFLYACLYAFCMYRNGSGITYFFFIGGSIIYICYCLSKLEITWKKGNYFYMISMVLLSISTFTTDDGRIIFFNKLGVFLLTISMLLSTMYNTQKWNLGKYLSSIATTCVMTVGEVFIPFGDAIWYCKNKLDKKNSKYIYIVLGIVITIPIFVIIFALLTSADAVFRNMSDRLLANMDFSDLIVVAWMIFFMFVASYGVLAYMCKNMLTEEVRDSRKGEPLIAIPVATILSLLYLVFSIVQIFYLFMGNMELPEGYTYAEYAREGFFQLLAVGIINLILVLVGLCYFRPNKVLKAILAVMSACTFIMLASSAMRMIIYIQYYYLTFLRILVLWSLVTLFLIFTGVIIHIFKEEFPLFRYSMVVVTCLYMVLSFSHPDYWIAKVNLEGSRETRSEFFKGECYDDFHYLSTLNADAAPVMLKWMHERGCDLRYYFVCEESEDDQAYDYLHFQDKLYTDELMTRGERTEAYRYVEHMQKRVGIITIRNLNVSRVVADQLIVWYTKRGI